MSSTEKRSDIGRAVARVRDRYRDTELKSGRLCPKCYTLVLRVMDDVKKEYFKITDLL